MYCDCNTSKYCYEPAGHVITGDVKTQYSTPFLTIDSYCLFTEVVVNAPVNAILFPKRWSQA